MSEARRHRARLAVQLLSGPQAADPVEVAAHLLAVQAQDPRGFRLAIRARTSGTTATDVDHALGERRLVVTWLNRGTLHLVTARDYWWLFPLTTPQLRRGNARRLAQEGLSAEQAVRGLDVVAAAVAEAPQTRAALRSRLTEAGVPTAGQGFLHVLFAAGLEGLTVRGPVVDGDHVFVSPEAWLGPPPPPLGEDEALGRLAFRYLRGHAPASAADLARWAGIPLGNARRGLAGLADRTVPVGSLGAGADGLFALADQQDLLAHPAPLPPPRLLGAFDPVLLGWRSRADVLGEHDPAVVSGGVFRPFAMAGGRAVATWGLRGGRIELGWLEQASARTRTALERDASDVLAFLGEWAGRTVR